MSSDSKEMVEVQEESLDEPVESISDQPATDDILELTNPIREYEEFNWWRADADSVPPCQFRIKSVRYLKQQNMELEAKEFAVPESDGLTAQIKCTVNGEFFKLWIVFRPPPSGPASREFNPIITTTLVANDTGFEFKFCCVFPFAQQFFYLRYCPIFIATYESCVSRFTNISNNKDSLTLRFVVKNGIFPDLPAAPVEGRSLLWQVDVSHLNLRAGVCFGNETQVGLSPFIRAHQSGILKVQVRLFVTGRNVEAERRFFNEHFRLFPRMKSVVSLGFVRPDGPGTLYKVDFEQSIDFSSEKTAKIYELFSIDQLLTHISDNKFRVQAELREYYA